MNPAGATDAARLDLFADPPQGLAYRAGFLTAPEEAWLLERLAEMAFEPFRFRGVEGRRRVRSFGWKYDFEGPGLVAAAPMPDWLIPLRDRAAGFAGLSPGALEQLLVNEYRPGAPIGWHSDRPVFDKVVGVSLGAPETLRLRRRAGRGWERREVLLEPRSAYLLSGEARSGWEHSLREARALRYSLTFRSLR